MQASGHKVLITGASRGIGLALARQFSAGPNQVILVGRDLEALTVAAAILPGALVRRADISNESDRHALVDEFNDLSVLVNNAGIQRNGSIQESASASIRDEFEVNLLAPILLTHAFLPILQRRTEAAVVNVSSVLALVPKQSASIYCSSKAGLHSFTKSLRWQLDGGPVKVFELMPPLVDTAMTAGRGSGKMLPEEIAKYFWRAFLSDQFEILPGKAKAARLLSRFAPLVVERMFRKA